MGCVIVHRVEGRIVSCGHNETNVAFNVSVSLDNRAACLYQLYEIS